MSTGRALLVLLLLAGIGLGAGTWLQQRGAQQHALERLTVAGADSGAGNGAASTASLFAASLHDAQGRAVALQRWRGHTLVINFWASWCPPCVAEMPDLSAFYAKQQQKHFEIVGIAMDNPAAVKAFLSQHPVTYPVLLGGTQGDALSLALGDTIDALPFTVVIDPAGRVVWQHAGRLDIADLATQLQALRP